MLFRLSVSIAIRSLTGPALFVVTTELDQLSLVDIAAPAGHIVHILHEHFAAEPVGAWMELQKGLGSLPS